MEGTALLPENTTIRGLISAQQGEKFHKVPQMGTVGRRTSLSDITNTVLRPNSAGEQDGVKVALPTSAKEYISQLVKENAALLKLLGERNNVIEMSSAELQKLRTALQVANQQNWQLAQANSRMLADLNLGKDRLKATQHELGCMVALLRAKTSELENKQLNKELFQTTGTEKQSTDSAEVSPGETVHVASFKKTCNASRKRMLRSQSLGSNNGRHQVASKEKDENRRKSLRRRSNDFDSEACEPPEELFEIEDVKVPIRSLVNDHKQEDTSAPLSSSATDEVPKDRIECSQNQSQVSRRSSIGRPLRKAAEKIGSYKEIPINVKMRREA